MYDAILEYMYQEEAFLVVVHVWWTASPTPMWDLMDSSVAEQQNQQLLITIKTTHVTLLEHIFHTSGPLRLYHINIPSPQGHMSLESEAHMPVYTCQLYKQF